MELDASQAPTSKFWLRDLEEDDAGDMDFFLLPRMVIGPDENSLKKVIEYRYNDDGNRVKITTTTRTRKATHKT
ncbi:hypothetical protein KSP40_PGU014247 [Platanthera guangdongensis]|uniref:Eukaryotic translation initiation factor 3 subunit G N-terminal domain-containing protein n=1 Tax=Platanthera guangdongensis TaxID=2320717 RepID=A0ABR2MTE5_9ASPA